MGCEYAATGSGPSTSCILPLSVLKLLSIVLNFALQVDSILAQVPDLKDLLSFYSQSEDDHFWVAVSGSEVAGSVAVKSGENGVAEIKRMQVLEQFDHSSTNCSFSQVTTQLEGVWVCSSVKPC